MPALGKYFILRSWLNDLVIELSEVGECAGAPVITGVQKSEAEGNEYQLWYIDRITNCIKSKVNDYCLDLNEEGVVVVEPYKKDRQEQCWVVNENKLEQQQDFELVLAIQNDMVEPGAQLICDELSESEGQCWDLKYKPPKYLVIRSQMAEKKVLDVSKSSAEPGARVILYQVKKDLDDNQLWYEDYFGILRSKLNDFVPDGSSGKFKLQPYDPENKMQQWVISGNKIQCKDDPKLVMDICGASTWDNTKIVPWEYHDAPNQHWYFDYVPNQDETLSHTGVGKDFCLASHLSGLVMAVGDVEDDVTPVVMQEKREKDHTQLWYDDKPTGTIRSLLNNCCLDLHEKTLVVKPFDPYRKQQRWKIIGCRIESRNQKLRVLEVCDDVTDPGALIGAAQYEEIPRQHWDVQYAPAVCFYMRNNLTKTVMSVHNRSKTSGTKVVMMPVKDSQCLSQLWYEDQKGHLRSKLNGYVPDVSEECTKLYPYTESNIQQQWTVLGDRIQSMVNPKFNLEVARASMREGADVVSKKYQGKDHQRWTLIPVLGSGLMNLKK